MKITTLSLNKKGITDYALERNKMLDKAKTDWVMFLDSDETLSGKIKINEDFDAFYLTRKNYFLGKYVGEDKIIRLMKKGSGKWERAVHETFKTSHPAGVIFDSFIIHNTADNLKDYINKINKYSDIHARENAKEGKKSSLFKIVFYPMGKFLVTLIKSRNVVFSIMQSFHSFLSWTRQYFFYS